MARGAQIRLGDLTVEGWSRAGQETWFRVHPPGLAFDCGRGTAMQAGVGDVFLSHGHLDHSLGLPYLISMRSLEGKASTRVFCPAAVAADVDAYIRAAERLERVTYRYELVPLAAGERVELGRSAIVEAFATDHVVPSLGFHLFHRKRRLAERFAGLSESEIVALRQQGVDPSEEVVEHRLTYCGDTGPALLEREERLFESQLLLLECTFLGESMRDLGNLYKHLHLKDLIPHAGRFRNRLVVFHHLSRRHEPEELRAAIEAALPELAGRAAFLVEGELR